MANPFELLAKKTKPSPASGSKATNALAGPLSPQCQ